LPPGGTKARPGRLGRRVGVDRWISACPYLPASSPACMLNHPPADLGIPIKSRRWESALRATRALKAAPWFLRFAILISSIRDQHTSDPSFRQCPIFREELSIDLVSISDPDRERRFRSQRRVQTRLATKLSGSRTRVLGHEFNDQAGDLVCLLVKCEMAGVE
jgi:hypothetical protein